MKQWEETEITFLMLKTTASKIDDLDATLCRVAKQNVLQRPLVNGSPERQKRRTSGFKSQCTIRWWRINDKDMSI